MLKIIAPAIVGLFLGWSGQVVAATTLKFAISAPEKTPWTKNAYETAAYINQATGGAVKINVFPGGQLGNEQNAIGQVARGRIDMGSFSNTAASLIVPEMALLAAPYLWDSARQADCALDNYLIPIFQEKFRQKGLIILGWSEVGVMGYAFKDPIRTMAGFTGKKLRVAPTKTSVILARNLTANPVMLPISAVASALQTGLVEGADLPGLAYTSLGVSEIARYWVASRHSRQSGVILVNENIWQTLNAIQQKIFIKAQANPAKLRKQVRDAEASSLFAFEKRGGVIITPDETEMQKWRRKGAQARTELIAAIGGDAREIFDKILAAKQACRQ